MSGLVLSLFPGIGLLDRGFEDEGFAVVRGPDLLWGGDVKKFHAPAGRFDGVIGGPPCKCFSPLVNVNRALGNKIAENLIPEFERVVAEAAPAWFLMENVPRAPAPQVSGFRVADVTLDNAAIGGDQRRVRRFCFGTPDGRPLRPRGRDTGALFPEPTVTGSEGGRRRHKTHDNRGRHRARESSVLLAPPTVARRAELQGLPIGFTIPAFTRKALVQAIGNGVPYTLARAVALAVREAMASTPISPSSEAKP